MSTPDPISPGLDAVYATVMAFIAQNLGLTSTGPGAQVVRGVPNRVSMPMPGFVVVQAIQKHRLRTSVDTFDTTSASPTTATVNQAVELTLQIDCRGESAEDWADILTTLFRDQYACNALAPVCQPLYCDDARMTGFVDGEEMYEETWSLDLHLQYNPTVTIPQQYAKALELELISVTEKFG